MPARIDMGLMQSYDYANGLAATIPIVVFLTYLGGVAPRLVLLAGAGLASTVFLLAAHAIAVSAEARTASRAFGSISGWLVLPLLVVMIRRMLWPGGPRWLVTVALWLLETSPMAVVAELTGVIPPVLWNEIYSNRGCRPAARVAGWLILATWIGLLGAATSWFAVPAFQEVAGRGYGAAPGGLAASDESPFARVLVNPFVIAAAGGTVPGQARLQFNTVLRQFSTMFSLLFVFSVVGAATQSLETEWKRDTWLSLLATPLTGWDILRAKGWSRHGARNGDGAARSHRVVAFLLRRHVCRTSLKYVPLLGASLLGAVLGARTVVAVSLIGIAAFTGWAASLIGAMNKGFDAAAGRPIRPGRR